MFNQLAQSVLRQFRREGRDIDTTGTMMVFSENCDALAQENIRYGQRQHKRYVAALQENGLEVVSVPKILDQTVKRYVDENADMLQKVEVCAMRSTVQPYLDALNKATRQNFQFAAVHDEGRAMAFYVGTPIMFWKRGLSYV